MRSPDTPAPPDAHERSDSSAPGRYAARTRTLFALALVAGALAYGAAAELILHRLFGLANRDVGGSAYLFFAGVWLVRAARQRPRPAAGRSPVPRADRELTPAALRAALPGALGWATPPIVAVVLFQHVFGIGR